MEQPLSQPNVIEALESRVLLANVIPHFWGNDVLPVQEQDVGVRRIGRTLYVRGGDDVDTLRINPGENTESGKAQIIVQFNSDSQTIVAGPLRRVRIDMGDGNDTVVINTDLPAPFNPFDVVIRGGNGDDTIQGGTLPERIFGDAGNDTLSGQGDRDIIHGGDGDDTITGGAGKDRLFGDAGDDLFRNNETADERALGSGKDLVVGGPGRDTADADAGDVRRLLEVPVPVAG